MSPRIRRTAKVFAAVTGAFLLYSLAAVPWIEPAGKRQDPLLASLVDAGGGTMIPLQEANLQSLFAPGDWELDNPMVLKTDRGMLLVRDYRTRDDGDLELVPCTLILSDTSPGGTGGETAAQRPLLLRSTQGALLRFDRPLDLTRGQFGQLVGGWLVGPVTIQSPESRPGANDALDVRTDHIQITRERIVAPHDVIFRYGENTGRGRDLIVNLAPSLGYGSSDSLSDTSFGALQSLELVHVESLKLRMPAADDMDDDPEDGQEAPKSKVPLSGDIRITCRGPFRLDFERLIASFEDRVEMVHANRDGHDDRLTCDLVRIHFRRSGSSQTDSRTSADRAPATQARLEVERVVLQGSPVVLELPSETLAARAQRLEYHPAEHQFLIADDQHAVLRYGQNEFYGKQLHYIPADEGRLGLLLAEGPGRLQGSLRGESDRTFEAHWQDRLIVQPHQGDQAISLLGGARVRSEGLGEFAADQLHLWLEEGPKDAEPDQSSRFAYRPARMLAEGNVRVDSQQLVGTTGKVEVWIRHDETAAPPSTPRSDSQDDARKDPLAARSPQRFELAGNHLQVQLLQRGNEMEVEHLILDGNVRLREIQTAKPGDAPLNVVGDLIQLEDANTPQGRMLVQGAPAEVAARQVAVVGEKIQLNRQRNRMWIAGPGRMMLPIAATALQGRQEPVESALAGSMTIDWADRMQFDGRLAQFEGDVRLRGQQPSQEGEVFDLLMAGGHLAVALTQRIDFSDDKPPSDVNVGRVAFRGDVVLQNAGYQNGLRTSIDRLHVRDLTLDQPTGRLHAAGPGWGASVRRAGTMPVGARRSPSAAQNPGRASDLVYVRVDFEDQIVGNLHDRMIEFQGRVRTLYGPVADWRDRLDPDPPDGLAPDVYLLTSDRLALAEMPAAGDDEAAVEVVADGNATIEGSHFTARAWRVSYARGKELLILQGDGRNDAELWLKGSVTPDAAAQQIRFWTHNNSIQVDGGRFFQLTQNR
jgi:hypothetical protein